MEALSEPRSPYPIASTCSNRTNKQGWSIRREPRLWLPGSGSRRRGLGRRGPEIRLQVTDRIQRGNGALHAVGVEGDEGSRMRGVQLRVSKWE